MLPTDSFVISRSGPLFGASLHEMDEVLIVRPNGTLHLARVKTQSSDAPVVHRAWRLLSGVGDLLLPDGARTITREGPLSGPGILDRVREGRTVRLEVISPTDLPAARDGREPRREVYRRCLSALGRRVIRVPQDVAISNGVGDGIERILEFARVRYEREDHSRWLVFTFEQIDSEAGLIGRGMASEAQPLQLLTAWESGDPPTSRTVLGDVGPRRRLLAALTAAGRPFEVRWVPSYRPVEARVGVTLPDAKPPFVPVYAVQEEMVPAVPIDLEEPGHLVSGLGLVTLSR